jgi:hypothetical protein
MTWTTSNGGGLGLGRAVGDVITSGGAGLGHSITTIPISTATHNAPATPYRHQRATADRSPITRQG